MTSVPTYDQLINPTISALRTLGGSGTIAEIYTTVAEQQGLSDQQLELLHNPERGSQTEIEYRLAWARTYLKKYGILENSARGVWALTAKGKTVEQVDPEAVKRFVQEELKQRKQAELVEEDQPEITENWRDQLLTTLLAMPPDAFERLVQRLLRESGFIQVEVTGRSGDGGVDGQGIMRLAGLLSFHVIFPVQTIPRFSGCWSGSRFSWGHGRAS